MDEALSQIWKLVYDFFQSAEIVDKCGNEAELQHELGFWLRMHLPKGASVRFERNVGFHCEDTSGLVKKEIDLVIIYPDDRHYAIELKFPRQGQHPEQMFQICKDLRFLEQLVQRGFEGGVFVIHVTDPLFYGRGSVEGIYAFFRGSATINGLIQKPTGARDAEILIQGRYSTEWVPCGEGRVWIQEVTPAALGLGEGFYLVDGVPHDKGFGIFAEDKEPAPDSVA